MINLDNKSFRGFVDDGVVLVKFEAPGCGPCMRMAPALDGLSLEYEKENIKFAKLNVDDDEGGKIFGDFRVSAVPTIIMLKEGKEVGRKIGLQSDAELRKWIDSNK